MKYDIISKYPDEKFKRITGIKRSVFDKMLETVNFEKQD